MRHPLRQTRKIDPNATFTDGAVQLTIQRLRAAVDNGSPLLGHWLFSLYGVPFFRQSPSSNESFQCIAILHNGRWFDGECSKKAFPAANLRARRASAEAPSEKCFCTGVPRHTVQGRLDIQSLKHTSRRWIGSPGRMFPLHPNADYRSWTFTDIYRLKKGTREAMVP
jgi:hypothetical protein